MTCPGKCLLLVEDDPLVRTTVAMMLEDDGFVVMEAGDADAAMAMIREGLQATIMVTDMDLGAGPSGADLADALRDLRPQLPVIFITGRISSMGGRALGPREALLPKPFATRTLSQMVRRMAG